jgi:hypothetical protein
MPIGTPISQYPTARTPLWSGSGHRLRLPKAIAPCLRWVRQDNRILDLGSHVFLTDLRHYQVEPLGVRMYCFIGSLGTAVLD